MKLQHSTIVLHQHALKRLGKLALMVISAGTVVRRLCLGKLALMVVTVITIIVLSLANIASLHQKESHFTGGLFVLKN